MALSRYGGMTRAHLDNLHQVDQDYAAAASACTEQLLICGCAEKVKQQVRTRPYQNSWSLLLFLSVLMPPISALVAIGVYYVRTRARASDEEGNRRSDRHMGLPERGMKNEMEDCEGLKEKTEVELEWWLEKPITIYLSEAMKRSKCLKGCHCVRSQRGQNGSTCRLIVRHANLPDLYRTDI
eukprot:6201897-Pleurochrysis_carterae.AAC.1